MTQHTQRTEPAETAATGRIASICAPVIRTFSTLASTCESWLIDAKRASYGLAVARILLGIMILGMVLLSNFATARYTFGPGAAWTGELENPTNSFASIFPFSWVNQAARSDVGITVVLLLLAACAILFTIGYRTRLVMIPLFVLWVGFLSINPYVQDQSDNLTRISFIALFFTGLSDRWSLDALRRAKFAGVGGPAVLKWWRYQQVLPAWITNAAHNLAVVVLICQLCFVYASGGLFKAGGAPWQAGTAVYDPLMTQRFGTWPILSDLVTAWGPAVAIGSIGTVLIQASFPFMLLNRFTRVIALLTILGFHLGIAILMGLPWFSLSMVALDAIFIRDKTWARLWRGFKSLLPRARNRTSGTNTSVSTPAEALLSV